MRGALLLLACGDALGAPLAGKTRIAPGAVDTVLSGASLPLQWTGCTAASVVVAEHVTRRGGMLDPGALGRGLASRRTWPRAEQSAADPGAAGWAGTPPALASPQDRLTAGAAAVSTAPLGLVPGRELPAVAEQARTAVAVAYHDRLVRDAAGVVAVAVLVGVIAFLRHQRSPWLAIRFAISAGADTSAAAAAAGALCGAYLGEQHVPSQWAARLAGHARLQMIAGALASLGRTTGDDPPPEAGHRTGGTASVICDGDRAGTGSGGKGHR